MCVPRSGVSSRSGSEFLRLEWNFCAWSIPVMSGASARSMVSLRNVVGTPVVALSSEYWHLQIYAYGHPAVKIGTPCKQ